MFNTLGGGNRGRGGMSPIMMGLMGLLAYRTLKGKGKLADMLGTNQAISLAPIRLAPTQAACRPAAD